jgi:hypothetical protein
MRALRTITRGDDLPLFGTIHRVKKGVYEVTIKFVKSRRTLHVERIHAPDVSAVKQFFAREYPTLTWGKPKYKRARKGSERVSERPRKPRINANPKGKKRDRTRTLDTR